MQRLWRRWEKRDMFSLRRERRYIADSQPSSGGNNPNPSSDPTPSSDYDSIITTINATNFPDDVFREYVRSNFDKNSDGCLSTSEISSATGIYVSNEGISSLKGIEYFTSLYDLDCSNNQLTKLDVSKNRLLCDLDCSNNQLTALNVSISTIFTALRTLDCSNNQLTTLNVGLCNKLTELDVRNNTALTTLYCENNQLTDSNTILIISPETFPDGKVGTDYYATLSANLSGVIWSASGLPSWLKIYASTGELYGKPTTGGTYTFTVTASLSSLKASKTYTIATSTGTSTPKPEFRTHSLVLSGQIGVNFFMYLPEISGVDYTKSYVEFDINGDKSNPPQYFDPTFKNSKGTYYGFRCYIKSIQMADKITATFHYGNNQTVTHEYSAKKYLDDSLAANISSEERALIEAIKDYGHYAQLYLSSIHTWELGRDYAAIDCENDYSAADIETVRKAVAGNAIVRDTGTASGVQRVGFSLSLDSDTNINLYIYPASGYTGAVSATLSGSNENLAVYQSHRNRYEVKISNISAHKLSDTYTVRVKAQKDFDVKVSAFSYVCDALNDSAASESERKAVVSLYKYYVTTMGYRAATGQ